MYYTYEQLKNEYNEQLNNCKTQALKLDEPAYVFKNFEIFAKNISDVNSFERLKDFHRTFTLLHLYIDEKHLHALTEIHFDIYSRYKQKQRVAHWDEVKDEYKQRFIEFANKYTFDAKKHYDEHATIFEPLNVEHFTLKHSIINRNKRYNAKSFMNEIAVRNNKGAKTREHRNIQKVLNVLQTWSTNEKLNVSRLAKQCEMNRRTITKAINSNIQIQTLWRQLQTS